MCISLQKVVFLFVLVVCRSKYAFSCPPELAVDATDGISFENIIIKDGITYSPANYDRERECLCYVKKCVRKCCPLNQAVKNRTCTDSSTNFLPKLESYIMSEINITSFHIIHGMVQCNDKNRFKLNPTFDKFVITINGHLNWQEEDLDYMNYCVDYFEDTKYFAALVCSEVTDDVPLFHNSIGMIISMPFLLTTFLVYALLPDRNLPAKALMCYVLSLLFAYIMLVTIQLSGSLEAIACKVIAFLCYFFFMVSFFWMNTSCIDIWLTFSGIKGLTGQRTAERKRFVYYCLYAWGVPLAMVSVVIGLTSLQEETSSELLPGIGAGQCWLKAGLPTGIYFYFPIAILVAFNIALFIITAIKIRRVQRDTKVLNAKDSTKHDHDKQRFNLYLKLLFAMGVNWSMEIISWAVQWKIANIPNYIWYLTDFCNAMYGVFIFFIFVFKRNIWMHLRKRYLQFMGKPTQAHTLGTSTHRTTLISQSLQSIPNAIINKVKPPNKGTRARIV